MTPIRLAEPTEAAEVSSVINAAFRPAEEFFVEGDRVSLEDTSHYMEKGAFLVAGEFAGVIYVELRGERGYFGLLSVHPEHQGAGIGGALIDAAEDYARQHHCRYMDIRVVNLRTELPPRYRRLGYHLTGTEPWPEDVPSKLPCHFLCMTKDLLNPVG